MMRDERLETALARLSAALASLEAVSRRMRDERQSRSTPAPDLAGELERVKAEKARLEVASNDVSRILEAATEALTEILSRQA